LVWAMKRTLDLLKNKEKYEIFRKNGLIVLSM
jgi:hypothetical protein